MNNEQPIEFIDELPPDNRPRRDNRSGRWNDVVATLLDNRNQWARVATFSNSKRASVTGAYIRKRFGADYTIRLQENSDNVELYARATADTHMEDKK